MIQIASIVGAALILAAYAAHQAGRLDRDSTLYHVLNVLGGGILCWVAVDAWQIGFVLLEGVWTAISVAGLVKTALRPARV